MTRVLPISIRAEPSRRDESGDDLTWTNLLGSGGLRKVKGTKKKGVVFIAAKDQYDEIPNSLAADHVVGRG